MDSFPSLPPPDDAAARDERVTAAFAEFIDAIEQRDAAEIVRDVADAVQYAHERGVIHRDLKPRNILLPWAGSSVSSGLPDNAMKTGAPSPPHGAPKITDFGLAKQLEHGSILTIPGEILGTPSYMSPEQAAGSPNTGPATDVYSLGAILYCCLTGRPPFQAAHPVETLRQVKEQDPAPPHAARRRGAAGFGNDRAEMFGEESGAAIRNRARRSGRIGTLLARGSRAKFGCVPNRAGTNCCTNIVAWFIAWRFRTTAKRWLRSPTIRWCESIRWPAASSSIFGRATRSRC